MLAEYTNLHEKTSHERYNEKITDNINNYGKGYLRNSHRNSLVNKSKEVDLI